MSDVAAFFRNPAGDPGETYQFDVKTDRGMHQFFVYARHRVNTTLFADQEIHQRDLPVVQKDVKASVRNLGGGIVIISSGDGTSRTIEMMPVATGAYIPATRYTILRPGYPSYSQAIDGAIKLKTGSLLLVPVDQDAEQQLDTILNLLKWFTPDFEALILNAACQPSLHARVSNVETQLFGKNAHAAAFEASLSGWKRFRHHFARTMKNPAFYAWTTAALLVILLAANAFMLRRLGAAPRTANPVAGKSMTQALSASSGASSKAAPVKGETLASRTRELLEEVHAHSTDRYLRVLYAMHFRDLDSPTDANVERWFSRQTSNPGNSRPFLLGLIKLQALKLEPEPKDMSFLESWDNITATKSVFLELPDRTRDKTGLRMIAALSCRLGYSDRPELPAFGQSSPALPLMQGTRCDELGLNDIERGIAQLTEFVKAQ